MSIKVLNMKPYKDPDEFIKNLGAEEFKKRIAEAKNSFMFEIEVIRRQYDLEDPEQKTAFYNQTAMKLTEFSEALERDNYIEAVAREYFINYQDLRRLVNQMGSRLVGERPRTEYQERGKKKEKEDGIRRSLRLLLTWLIEEPRLFDKIKGIVGPEDFGDGVYGEAARMVFEAHGQGRVEPAAILNHFINDEEQYKEVAALFNASLRESLGNEEQRKAFAETVRRVKNTALTPRAGMRRTLRSSSGSSGSRQSFPICIFLLIRAKIKPVPAQEGRMSYGRKDENI